MARASLTLVPPAVPPVVRPATAGAAAAVAKAHPVVAHAMKAGALQTDRATRALADARATVEVFASGGDPATWQELSQMRDAAWRRLRALQDSWLKDWVQWLQYAGQIRGANTMSKLVERESNIGVQISQLIGEQFTGLVGLQENIEVDYSYWINGKLAEKRQSTSSAPSPPS